MKKLALLLLLLPITGCGYGPWAKKVAAFSTTAPPALTEVMADYQSADNVHTLEQEATIVENYSREHYQPGQVKPLISDEDLAARRAAADVLTNYANLVGDLALGKRLQNIGTRTKALNQSMTAAKGMATSVSSKKKISTTTMTPQQMGYVLDGLDMAVKPLIEHKVRKLPEVIRKADPFVAQLCQLFTADLETLRTQQKADYRTMLMEQSQFIAEHPEMSAVDKRNEIIKLVQIDQNAAKADADTVRVEHAITEVADAHHKLAVGGTK